jgi:hypothetical protein
LCDPHCRLEYARVFSSPPLCNSFEIQNHSASESDQLESTTCGTRPHLQDRYGAKLQTSCRDQKARCVRGKPNSFAFLTCAETTPSLHHSCSQRSLNITCSNHRTAHADHDSLPFSLRLSKCSTPIATCATGIKRGTVAFCLLQLSPMVNQNTRRI